MVFIAVAVEMLRMLKGQSRWRVQGGEGVAPLLVSNGDETIRSMA